MRTPKAPPRAALTIVFSLIIFLILTITMLLVGGAVYLLSRTGLLDDIGPPNLLLPLVLFALVSIVTGTVIGLLTSAIPLKPVNRLLSGLNRLASGDYKVRLEVGRHPAHRDIEESFNILAEELQNTEMLRSDFVNNFSHEFKTPIVSIRGFAELLLKGGLTEEHQREYLEIIVEESGRLADMATNVLDLTKVENQSILTDITRFNLSEQMRNCILLLEARWAEKELAVTADFAEYDIEANEELLKQVWINLLDNAVKFSPRAGEISVTISRGDDKIRVSIKNTGPEISAGDQRRVFNKYWQADTSHASSGAGVGLSIARRIAELHHGQISVDSTPERTVFLVELPC